MRVELAHTNGFVEGHDLLEARLAGEAYQLDAGEAETRAAAHEFEVQADLVAEVLRQLLDQREAPARRERGLQVGQAWIGSQCPHRRVVPAQEERRYEPRGAHIRGRLTIGDSAAELRRQLLERFPGRLGHHDDRAAAPLRDELADRLQVGLGNRRRHHPTELLDDRGLLREGLSEADRGHEVVEHNHAVDPVDGGCRGHLELGDDARRAVGVGDTCNVAAAQFQHPWRLLEGHDTGTQDIAAFAQHSPGDRADTARTACDETAERRRVTRRGMHTQFLPAGRKRLLEHPHADAGLDPEHARSDPQHAIEVRQVEDDAAMDRHALAVVRGAPSARRDRHVEPETGLRDNDDFRLAARQDDRLRHDVGKLAAQHRAIPKVVAALADQRFAFDDDRYALDRLEEPRGERHRNPRPACGVARGPRWRVRRIMSTTPG